MIEHYSIHPEASSNVKWARWDSEKQLCYIDFKDKDGNYASTYEYGSLAGGRKFTRDDWEEFRAALRPGQHFAYKIKGVFSYRKIKERAEPDGKEEPPAQQESLF